MRRRVLSLIRVRAKPGRPTCGILLAGPHTIPVPTRRIYRTLAWCEDTTDRRYNRPFRRAADDGGDRLWRDDHLYDFIIEIDHNTRPRIAGRGSAVFVHLARRNRSPTAGCVALAPKDLQRLLAVLGPQTRIAVEL
jgi:L,D-peptidoglycan transpeptidase YkuD (ErfK/YbiS/YcfS/YnhG family)